MFKKRITILSTPVWHFLLCVLSIFFFLALPRFVFWNTFGSGTLPLHAWSTGLRFDAVIGIYAAAPLLFPLLWTRLTRIARCLSALAAMIITIIVVADYLYFPSSAKRLGYEAWVYLNPELIPIALTALRATPVVSSIALVLIFALIFVFYKFVKLPNISGSKANIAWFFGFTALSIVLARGGVQRVPIRLGDAIVSTSPLINNAVLNAPCSVLASGLVTRGTSTVPGSLIQNDKVAPKRDQFR